MYQNSIVGSAAPSWRALSVLAVFAFLVSSPLQARHAVALNDLLGVTTVDALRLSPDGAKLAFKVEGGVADGHWRLISIADPDTSRDLGVLESPEWSATGRSLAYVSQRSGTYQIRVLDVMSFRSTQVTHVPGGLDPSVYAVSLTDNRFGLAWSPDGSKLAFHSNVAVPPPRGLYAPETPIRPGARTGGRGKPLVLTLDTPTDWTLSGVFSHGFGSVRLRNGQWKYDPRAAGQRPTVSQLFVVDVRTGQSQQVTHDSSQYFEPDWSPEGGKLVCVSFEGRDPFGFGGRGNLYSIDIATGARTQLTKGLRDHWYPRWSPDGKWIASWSGLWEGQRVGVHTVSAIPASGGDERDLFAAHPESTSAFFWSSDSESIVAGNSYGSGVSETIFRANLSTGVVDEIAGDGLAVRRHVSASRSGDIVWDQQDGLSPPSVMLLQRETPRPKRLLELNPQVRDWDLGRQEIIRWTTKRGVEREGILIKPLGFEDGHRYPVIVDLYPSMTNHFYASPIAANQSWASRGYAVFLPRPHAPFVWMTFLSAADREAAKGPEGWDIAVDDVLSGVDELIRRGIVDPDRMGLYGLSNGGGVVATVVAHTPRFRCAVIAAGASMDYSFMQLFYSDFNAADYLGKSEDLWRDPISYVNFSAPFHADRIETPMLLEDGDEDVGEFLIPTIELYNGLRRFGKEVTLLRYPNQGHVLENGALADFWERENRFFDKYLKLKPSASSYMR